jgi:hypothetical protein
MSAAVNVCLRASRPSSPRHDAPLVDGLGSHDRTIVETSAESALLIGGLRWPAIVYERATDMW